MALHPESKEVGAEGSRRMAVCESTTLSSVTALQSLPITSVDEQEGAAC